MQAINHIDLIKIIELTVRDVTEKNATAIKQLLGKFLEESNVKLPKTRITEMLEELKKFTELEDTIRSTENIVVDANSVAILCKHILNFIEQRGRSVELRSTPKRESDKPELNVTMGTYTQKLNKNSSDVEKKAWELINQS